MVTISMMKAEVKMQMTMRWFGPQEDKIPLEYIRQVPGVEGVVGALYDVAPGEVWPVEKIKALIEQAHAAGLKVAVWTLRAENVFLPLEHRRGSEPAAYGDLAAYAAAILDADVDAVFSDFPAITVAAAQPPRN